MRRTKLVAICIMVLGAGLFATGCESYALRGRVVRGEVSYVAIVDANDPRLDGDGLPGVSLHLQSDPGRLNRKTIGRGVSGASGEVELSVDLAGAGFLQYDVGLFARRSDHAPATGFFELPSSKKRVLVVMAQGADRELGEDREDLRDQASQYR